MILPILVLFCVKPIVSLIGFECGGQHLNVTSISLLDVKECNLDYKPPNTSEVHIQLLQLSDYAYTEVMQCKVEISSTIYYCGMNSHVSVVHNGRSDYVHETSYTPCMRMFQDGTLSLGAPNLLTGIKVNKTTTHSVTLAGRINNDGSCKGIQFSNPYGTWDDVVVQASVKVSLRSSYVPVQINSGKIMLKSGTICNLSDGRCLDPDNGYTYWKSMPTSSCNFHQYDVLYEGTAVKIIDDINKSTSPTVYSLTTQDITFALTKTNEQPVCGYTLLQTEHPKLFILETQKGEAFTKRGYIPLENLDIFAYMNSKFVYVEKHVRNQMTSLYYNVMQQKCELERQVLENALSLATLRPDEFAYTIMKGPGYMAVTTGEAIQIIKCIPVDVVVRKTKECYTELPITVRNASLFLTPKSRMITKFGNQRECSYELPTLYRVEDIWVQFTPEPHVKQSPPQQLEPMTKLSWNYLTPGPLAVSGIYSERDIEKLRDHIMFPAEKPALLNTIARGLTGHTTDTNSASVYNLLDENSLNKIAEKTTKKIWSGFITFGSATAGILGIMIVIRLIKLVIDTAIHGYALHSVYGCSLHLLGAVWSSLTHLLIHLARGPINQRGNRPDNNANSSSPCAPEKSALPDSPPTATGQPPLPDQPPAIQAPATQPRTTSTNHSTSDIEPTVAVNIDDFSYQKLCDRLSRVN